MNRFFCCNFVTVNYLIMSVFVEEDVKVEICKKLKNETFIITSGRTTSYYTLCYLRTRFW